MKVVDPTNGLEGHAHKGRGAFFTPHEIARFITDWAVRSPTDAILEPSCGDAAFLLPVAERLSALGATREKIASALHGIDVFEPAVREAKLKLAAAGHIAQLETKDFFEHESPCRYDAVVGNPPFIRYQQFSGSSRAASLKIALSQGVRLTSLASSWAAFTLHASSFLKDDGRLGMVLPAELLSVSYAAEMRRFLLHRFAKVRLVVFEQLVFPGVLEEVILLLAEGRGQADHFELYQARNLNDLAKIDIAAWQGFSPAAGEKWTPALIPTEALQTYRALTSTSDFSVLKAWGSTFLGSVTGNNDFFTLTGADVARIGLNEDEIVPISPPGARHLRGLSFSKVAWTSLRRDDSRVYLFYPPNVMSAAARAYIAEGERLGVHRAYKCKVRAPWWRVPQVKTPDLLFAYMNHERPRLVTNNANVAVLNSVYGIELKSEVRKLGRSALPIACLNTISLLGSEIVGRAYGGGLLKHEPREVDQLPVPGPALLAAVEEDLKLVEPQLAIALRQNKLLPAVELVDSIILERHLRLDFSQIQQLRLAREMLFRRRVARARGQNGSN